MTSDLGLRSAAAPVCSNARRGFLRGLAGAVLSHHTLGRADSADRAPPPHRFTRLFPHLPPFAPATPQVKAALLDIGRPGGLMDANDNLAAGPVALIVDPALSLHNPNATEPDGNAGTTFIGQFIDHDMTFDVGSRLGVPTDPRRATNARLPALELDSVYGAGPVADPLLYDRATASNCELESGGAVRGPAAHRRRRGPHRRPAQRREPADRRACMPRS